MVAYGQEAENTLCCLAVSGPWLVSGSQARQWIASVDRNDLQAEVKVWSLEELSLQHTLPQPVNSDMRALLAIDQEVWGAVGRDVFLWRNW